MRRQRAHSIGPQQAATQPMQGRPLQGGGRGNAAIQEQMRARQGTNLAQGPGNGQGQARFAGQDALLASVSGEQLVASNVNDFMKTNLYKAMVRLVDKEGWDPEFAASWLGQAVVETGKPNLEKLDVVEHGTGIGRGMLQYSYSRRGPYDRARAQALQQGQDPNDINWQIDYALKKDNAGMNLDAMRQGLTDPEQNYRFQPGWGTASGFTPTGKPYGNRFPDANSLMAAYGEDRVGGYTRALSGEYTRPGEHHMDRRLAASKRILKMFNEARKTQPTAPFPGGPGVLV